MNSSQPGNIWACWGRSYGGHFPYILNVALGRLCHSLGLRHCGPLLGCAHIKQDTGTRNLAGSLQAEVFILFTSVLSAPVWGSDATASSVEPCEARRKASSTPPSAGFGSDF